MKSDGECLHLYLQLFFWRQVLVSEAGHPEATMAQKGNWWKGKIKYMRNLRVFICTVVPDINWKTDEGLTCNKRCYNYDIIQPIKNIFYWFLTMYKSIRFKIVFELFHCPALFLSSRYLLHHVCVRKYLLQGRNIVFPVVFSFLHGSVCIKGSTFEEQPVCV